jgi:hypothetical protein
VSSQVMPKCWVNVYPMLDLSSYTCPKEFAVPPNTTYDAKPVSSRIAGMEGSEVPSVKAPKPERVCRGCGKTIQRDSTNCRECDLRIATKRLVEVAKAGRVAGHTPEVIAKVRCVGRRPVPLSQRGAAGLRVGC